MINEVPLAHDKHGKYSFVFRNSGSHLETRCH